MTNSTSSNYSQHGQAEWILKFTSDIGINRGVCFEAGAASPHFISNSRCFIEAGWKAILVENSSEHCIEWESLNLTNVEVHKKK